MLAANPNLDMDAGIQVSQRMLDACSDWDSFGKMSRGGGARMLAMQPSWQAGGGGGGLGAVEVEVVADPTPFRPIMGAPQLQKMQSSGSTLLPSISFGRRSIPSLRLVDPVPARPVGYLRMSSSLDVVRQRVELPAASPILKKSSSKGARSFRQSTSSDVLMKKQSSEAMCGTQSWMPWKARSKRKSSDGNIAGLPDLLQQTRSLLGPYNYTSSTVAAARVSIGSGDGGDWEMEEEVQQERSSAPSRLNPQRSLKTDSVFDAEDEERSSWSTDISQPLQAVAEVDGPSMSINFVLSAATKAVVCFEGVRVQALGGNSSLQNLSDG
eukprot:gene31796-6995_t